MKVSKMWYVKRGDKVVGPHDLIKLQEAVRKGQIVASDLFSKNKFGPWVKFETINSVDGGEEADHDDDDWATVSSSVNRKRGPNPAPIEEVEPNRLWQLCGLTVTLGVSVFAGMMLGLLPGFVIWGRGKPDVEVAVATGEAVDSVLKGDDKAVDRLSTVEASRQEPRDSSQSSLDNVVNHGGIIKQRLHEFYEKFGVSLKDVYGLCVEDEQALEILSSCKWGGKSEDAILSFSDMPSEDALRSAAASAEKVVIPFKYNAKERNFVMQFVDSQWKVDYVETWKRLQGFDRKFPVTVGMTIFRKPDDFKQHEVVIHVVNDSKRSIVLTGKCRNPVMKESVLVQCAPNRTESDSLSFVGANSGMNRSMVLDGSFFLECDVFPAGAGVDTFQKKLFKVQFIVEDKEFENVQIACRQPHEVRKMSNGWSPKDDE